MHLQRLAVRTMLKEWELKFPGRVEAIFSSICNVSASQLADPKLFDFAGLEQLRALAERQDRLTATCGEPHSAAAEA
jgi:tRNA 2-thiocytidine biosynthesis protein TtcA